MLSECAYNRNKQEVVICLRGSSISGKSCGHSGNPDGCEVLIYFIDFISVTQYNKKSWRRIEAVITGRTRNALALRGTRVRIPPSPLKGLISQPLFLSLQKRKGRKIRPLLHNSSLQFYSYRNYCNKESTPWLDWLA